MKLHTEIVEEKQSALIVSKKNHSFITLLKNELKRVSIDYFSSPIIPKAVKMFRYIFIVNETVAIEKIIDNKNIIFVHIFFGKKIIILIKKITQKMLRLLK